MSTHHRFLLENRRVMIDAARVPVCEMSEHLTDLQKAAAILMQTLQYAEREAADLGFVRAAATLHDARSALIADFLPTTEADARDALSKLDGAA